MKDTPLMSQFLWLVEAYALSLKKDPILYQKLLLNAF